MSRTSPNYASILESTPIATPKANGRIDIMEDSKLEIPGYMSKASQDNSTFCDEALLGNWSKTELSTIFFSVDNIEALHQGIRYLVYKRSRQVIGRQSDQELKIIMKGIYLQHAQHSRNDVLSQVRDLNKLVLEFAVKQIMTNLEQYTKYKVDISTLPEPMDRSTNMSIKGTKTLELKNFV